jgi:hypothetical protein
MTRIRAPALLILICIVSFPERCLHSTEEDVVVIQGQTVLVVN